MVGLLHGRQPSPTLQSMRACVERVLHLYRDVGAAPARALAEQSSLFPVCLLLPPLTAACRRMILAFNKFHLLPH